MSDPSQKTIRCMSCYGHHQVGSLDAIATHWYVSPSGCTEGDYWVEGEWHFVCPKTGVRNRLLFNVSGEEEQNKVDAEGVFKRLFRGAFKSMGKVYERGGLDKPIYQWVNNYHVDQNRLSYGLPVWVPSVPGRVRWE